MAAPNITNHSPATPSPGEEVLLSFSVNFLGGDWQLEYFDNGWKIMPKGAMVIYQNGLVVRIPPTFNGNSMTVCFVVNPNSNLQYSSDYTFNIALPKDRIQYNQSGTIRNMEAKYNHNGVIKNVECWYNHNGVLKKVQ